MKKRLNLKIIGQVQGIGFRYWAQQQAQKFGLTGWVKNEDDGSVSLVVEGDEEDLKKFLDICKKGSSFSSVEEIQEAWGKSTGEFQNFEIKF